MAHHKSAKKRIRVSLRRRVRNKQYLSKVRTTIKKFRVLVGAATESGSGTSSQELQKCFGLVQSLLARAYSKGIIHRNTAARKTKRLHSLLKKATAG